MRKMIKKRAKIILLSGLVVVSLFFLLEKNFLPGISTKSPSSKNLQFLGTVINLIKNHYIEEPNPLKTMEGAFKGLVDSLDILSSYLDKESAIKYKYQKEERLNETGIILYKKYGSFPQVIGIIKNSPAEKKEIKIGDLISAIDNSPTLPMSMLEANLHLKDKEETSIKLKIIGRNETQEITIKRKLLFEEPVSYSPLKDSSGILKIHHLYPPCVNKIKEEILPRIRPQKKTLILDFRNCFEGELEEAWRLTNLFLKAKEIGYIEKKGGVKEILSCEKEPELGKLPIIIWTNQATLGPAEAVAAVLNEFKKAKILGLPTPGLVAKQDFFALENGSALVLTSGIFHLKSGKKLWKSGLTPDVKIKREDQNDESYLKSTLILLRRM